MTSALDNLTGPGKPLAAEAPDAREFEKMRSAAMARLEDARSTANSLEGRFDLAYNAAHGLCLAALRWHGYRANHRYIAVDDIKAAMDRVKKAGGHVLGEPMDIPGVGAYVSFEDTEGNRVSILQPLPK